MEEKEKKIYDLFEKIGIKDYKVHEHKAIYTVQDAEEEGLKSEGISLKNLLVKDKKTGEFYLIILEDHRHMDEKHFKKIAGWSKIRFANEEELWQVMELKPGSVGPFGLINCSREKVTVILDGIITGADDDERVNFHPNRNTATLSLSKKDFIKFLDYLKIEVIFENVY